MTAGQIPLLERDPELTAFAVRASEALEGQGSVIVVRGVAGAGKSRLLAEVRASGEALGMRALVGRGSRSEQDLAFGVAEQLVGPLAGPERMRSWSQALAEGPQALGTLGEVFTLLADAAAAQPLLLTVDDLLLADGPSQRLLVFLAHRLRANRILLVVSARPTSPDEQLTPAAEVLDDADALLLRPRPLSPDAVARLVGARLGGRPERSFAEAVHELSRGIPGDLARLIDRAEHAALRPVASDVPALRALAEGGPEPWDPAVSAATARETALGRARKLSFAGEPAGAARVLVEAAAHTEDPGIAFALEAELQLLGRVALHVRTRDPQRLRELARALHRDDPALRIALAASALDGALRAEPASGVATMAEVAWAGGRLLADEGPHSPAVHAVAATLVLAEHEPAAQGVLDAILGTARRNGAPGPEALALCLLSRLALLRGDAHGGQRYALEAVEAAQSPEARLSHATAVACLALVRGLALGTSPAEELVDATIRDGPPAGAPFADALLLVRGMALVEGGDLSEALEDLLECGRRQESRGILNPAVMHWRSTAAVALVRLEQAPRARELALRDVELARRFGAPRSLSRVLVAAGQALRGAEGLELLREAVVLADLHGEALAQAAALLELGSSLRRAGARIEAREHLHRARRLAEGSGMERISRRAAEELLVAGARPRRAHAHGPESLTLRERRIVDLAAAGSTNRAIANELYVTVKTVEMHLSNAYRKLGVGSRSQLASILIGDEDR